MATPNTATQTIDMTVAQYLKKKGMKQQDIQNIIAGPVVDIKPSAKELLNGYTNLREWAYSSLEIYRTQLCSVLYPLFVHIYFELVQAHAPTATAFMQKYKTDHLHYHLDEISKIQNLTTVQQMGESDFVRVFRSSRFNLDMSSSSINLLLTWLEEHKCHAVLQLVNSHLTMKPNNCYGIVSDLKGEQTMSINSKPVYWGFFDEHFGTKDPATIESDLMDDKNEPQSKKIKRDKEVHKTSVSIPKLSDQLEQEYLEDIKKRVQVDPKHLPSVCFYTLFHTHQGLNHVEVSQDSSMIAGTFADSTVRLWDLNKQRKRILQPVDEEEKRGNQYKVLVGHSGPVYSASFSPDHLFLLTASEDKTVRLWGLETRSTLVCYKAHNFPVWDVDFSPLGYHFATASNDRTAKLWSTESTSPLRIFAGHLSDVNCVKFHPNCNFIATGSTDKTVRLWDIQSGNPVRIFTGHTSPITCIAVSPDGKTAASAAEDHKIILWDLSTSKKMATFEGHKKSIWSLSFCSDGSLLASGSADQTVRLWDCTLGSKSSVTATIQSMDTDSQSAPENSSKAEDQPAEQTLKRIGPPEPLKTFPTKSTPVYKVHFTRRNLLLAAGPFLGEPPVAETSGKSIVS